MIGDTRIGPALDERLEGLASVPAEHYLAAGQSARSRRGRRRTGGVLGLAVAGILVATQALPSDDGSQVARERRPDISASQGTTEPSTLSSQHVETGVGGIDSYTTDAVPSWAKEYGNHGPAAIAPDGRLWIAPEASVVRSIADPVAADGTLAKSAVAGIVHSYAVEVWWHSPDDEQGKDSLVWWLGFREPGNTSTFGTMDDADRWTSDFALWTDAELASFVGGTRFADQLVRFENDQSKVLVPLPGVEIVRQTTDVDTGDMEQYGRRSAAEVVVGGQTYFVLANGRRAGSYAFYEPYEAAVAAPDLPGFLQFVADGFVSKGTAP